MPQSYYKLYYHLIWGTKKKLPLITLEVEKLLKEYIPKKVVEYGGQQIEFNMVKDHIHWLGIIPPKISIAEFVHNLKGSSTYYINTARGEKSFYWQSGYGVVSLSAKGVRFVKAYIKNQKQKHADNDLLAVLEHIPKEEY
jgi:REP element-mobilizing transposase RayT